MAHFSPAASQTVESEANPSINAVPMTPYTWYVVALLALVYAVHTMDRGVLVILLEPIGQEFHLSDTQLGFLAGFAYAIAFSIAAIPLGMLADRVNRARLLVLLIAVWSALTTVSGFATGYPFLLGARVAVGMAEAGGQPTSLSIISDYVPPRRRALAAGIFMSGTGFGTLLGLSATGAVAAAYGWRKAFLVVGPAGLIVALIVLLTLREPRERSVQTQAGVGYGATIRFIARQRGLSLTLLGSIIVIFANAGVSVWMTPLLMRSHGMSLAHAGYATALVNGAMTLAGALGGAFITDRLGRSGLGAQLKFGVVAAFAAGMALVGVAMAGDFGHALVGFMLWALAYTSINGVSFGIPVALVPSAMRGATVGTLAVMNNLVGYGLGPLAIGRLSDSLKPTLGHASLSMAVLVVGITAYLVASVVFVFAARLVDGDLARAEAWRPATR